MENVKKLMVVAVLIAQMAPVARAGTQELQPKREKIKSLLPGIVAATGLTSIASAVLAAKLASEPAVYYPSGSPSMVMDEAKKARRVIGLGSFSLVNALGSVGVLVLAKRSDSKKQEAVKQK